MYITIRLDKNNTRLYRSITIMNIDYMTYNMYVYNHADRLHVRTYVQYMYMHV